jgi:transposase
LCDEYGDPVAVEVFSGNTQDTRTFGSQVKKVAELQRPSELTHICSEELTHR